MDSAGGSKKIKVTDNVIIENKNQIIKLKERVVPSS